jgi:hypothetical protein
MTRQALLACGVLAALLYVGTDILAALRYEGYSYTAQTVSETFAIGAPTRPLIILRGLAFSLLVIAFGLGVWGSVRGKGALRITGGLLVGIGVVDMAGPFAPMHQRAVLAAGGGTLTDTMHIILASVDVLFILFIIGFGAAAFGKQFRLYSIGTILAVITFGALAGLDGPRVSANLPTPWVGVTERIGIFGYMLWMVVLAITLLCVQGTSAETGRQGG